MLISSRVQVSAWLAVFSVIGVLFAAVVSAPRRPMPTLEKFTRLGAGMTLDNVVGIMGEAGQETSVDYGHRVLRSYRWKAEGFRDPYGTLKVTMERGKLVKKEQLGLPSCPSCK